MSGSNSSSLVELRGADKVVAIGELYSLIRRIVELELILMDFKMWLIDRVTEIGKDCVVPKDIANDIERFSDIVGIWYTDLKNKLDYVINVFRDLRET